MYFVIETGGNYAANKLQSCSETCKKRGDEHDNNVLFIQDMVSAMSQKVYVIYDDKRHRVYGNERTFITDYKYTDRKSRQHCAKKAFYSLGVKTKRFTVITGMDEDDNMQGYDVDGYLCVRVGDVNKAVQAGGGKIPLYIYRKEAPRDELLDFLDDMIFHRPAGVYDIQHLNNADVEVVVEEEEEDI